MAATLKGQETVVSVVSAIDGLRAEFTNVKDCEVTFAGSLIEEDYLGQTTVDVDDVFEGVGVKFTVHSSNPAILDLIDRINNIKQGLVSDSITVATTLRFSSGTRRIIIPDVKFGALSVNIGGRKEKVNFPFEGKAARYKMLTT